MTTVYVQYSDATETMVVSVFSCPQDPAEWPNQGTLPTSDARWRTFYEAQPPFNQRYLPAPS